MKLSAEKKDIVSEVFSNKEKDEIIKRTLGGRDDIDSSFLYKGNGGEYYDKILISGKYEAYQNEINLLKKNSKELQKYVGSAVTDIGCGNGEKVIDLLQGYDKLKNTKYIASDYSASMIEIAENNVSQNLPDIQLGNHQIMRQGNELFTNALDNNTYLRLGCTMGNVSRDDIIKNIQKMNNRGIFKGNNIIFSYFDVPTNDVEIKKTIALYDNDVGRDFVFNGLKNLGIDVSNFDFVVDYNLQNNCIYMGVDVRNDYDITLSDGRVVHLPKGKRFFIHQSKRFSYEDIQKILKQSGSRVKKHIFENGISIVVARQDPKYLAKAMKITVVTAGFLAVALGGYEYAVHKQEQHRKDIETDVLKSQLKNKELSVGFHGVRDYKKTPEDKIQMLESGTNNVYSDFVGIYGMGNMSEEAIKAVIKNELSKGNNLNILYTDMDNPTRYNIRFVKEQLVPNNKVLFASSGLSMVPYENLQEYKNVFENTLKLDGDMKIIYNEVDHSVRIKENTTKIKDFGAEKSEGGMVPRVSYSKAEFKKIGNYVPTNSYGIPFDIMKIMVDVDGKNEEFIVVTTTPYGVYKFNEYEYSLGAAKKIAEDFLKNWAVK